MKQFLNALSLILSWLPLGAVRKLGACLGRLLGLFSRRKLEIRDRIAHCLAVDPAEAKRIMWRMYANLGITLLETLRLPHTREEELLREIQYIGFEKLNACHHAYIAAVAHTGNWEWMAAATTPKLGAELNIVVKALKPQSLNEWITACRSKYGTRVHDRRGSSRSLIQVLKQGKPLGFMVDQNAKRNWGIFVDFFGTPACTTDGLAHLAAISNKPVFPVFCRRNPGTYSLVVEIGEEISYPRDRSAEEIERVTRAVTRALEDFIRRYPDQWIWMHRRWRTRPETYSS